MNASIYRISLDIHEPHSNVCLDVKRGDTNRKIIISLTDGGFPYKISEECTAVLTGKKPDNKIVYNDCAIENNAIIYELTQQASLVPGLVKCEVKLYGADGKLITSPKFSIIVDDTVYNEGDEIESEDEITYLTSLIRETADAIRDAKVAANAANDVADALLQAKESGEFNGAKGDVGVFNPNGEKTNIDMGGYKVTGLGTPTSDSDAAPWGMVAPAGYGYGGYAINIGAVNNEEELTNAVESVYSAMRDGETKMIRWSHYPSTSDWVFFAILSKSSANYGSLVAQSAVNSGSRLIKAKYNGAWQPIQWENYAPAGYVSEKHDFTDYASALVYIKSVYASMQDKTKKCLFVNISTGSTMKGEFPNGSYFVEIYREWSNYGIVEFSNSTHLKIVVRISGSWGDFCYENPVMIIGVEYRTTERFNGEVVYRKLVSYATDAIDATAIQKDINIPHGITNFKKLISCMATKDTGFQFPYMAASMGGACVNIVDTSKIVFRVLQDSYSAGTLYFDIKYTKTA